MENEYDITCSRCNKEFDQRTKSVLCPKCGTSALLKTFYTGPVNLDTRFSNFYMYRNFLPVRSTFKQLSSLPGCYKSRNLAKDLGLKNLWILFNGYWPEKGARIESTSFKEFEAIGLLSRFAEQSDKMPVISSAGNTALSTLYISRILKLPALVVAPEFACKQFKFPFPSNKTIKTGENGAFLISLKNAEYKDCIDFAFRLCRRLRTAAPTGGVFNVARRDFIAIPMIHSIFTMQQIPDHYFQAVGSGSGAIAAWEAVYRLSGKAGFAPNTMKLHLAQNRPFTPLLDLWGNREIQNHSKAGRVLAKVLTNPDPAFHVTGGLREALADTAGRVYGVTNDEIRHAKARFEKLEGCDIQYPAAASLAALEQAVKTRKVAPEDTILLNITGGGEKRLEQDKPLFPCDPSLTISQDEIETAAEALSGIVSAFDRKSA